MFLPFLGGWTGGYKRGVKMKNKLVRRYFVVGLLDIVLGVAEVILAKGRIHTMILGAAFLAFGAINFYNCYKAYRRDV